MSGFPWARSIGKPALCVAGASAVVAAAMLGVATSVAGGAEAPAGPGSYEAVASAEGVRFSFGAPGFAAVGTFIDGGGPVSQALIDGLGNSRAFASLPYPGDLAISGPGLVAGLAGLPSPPPYPFYVSSSHPTAPEAMLSQPGYGLAARSAESSSEGSTMTGAGSSDAAVASTVTRAVTSRDAVSGVVTAEATGTADIINIGGVLRIGQVDARAKVTRAPGGEPTREASFAVNGMTIAGQTVGFSEKGFTLAGTNTPIPQENPLLAVLAQAKITVQSLSRVDNPDGVVSPGLVIRQEQATPGGPTMVIHYVIGQMAVSATVSGSATSIGDSLPAIGTGPSDAQEIDFPVAPAPALSSMTTGPAALPVTTGDGNRDGGRGSGAGAFDSDSSTPAEPTPQVGEPPAASILEAAAPVARPPMTEVDTTGIYLILVAGAAVALAGGTVLRLLGVQLKWTS
jgi:hypothetical protein